MPSGITHILLAKKIQDHIRDTGLRTLLQAGIPFLEAGAVGPDLPYASIADGDLFLEDESELADKFHYEKTNQVVLSAFRKIKAGRYPPRELDSLFCFFAGYALHIIADGVIHPFIRDKVGDYKPNKTAHRVLELKLDVIYLNEITRETGRPLNLNSTNIHDELLDILTYAYRDVVFKLFSEIIREVYGLKYKPKKIAGWIEGLHTMFSVAEGDHLRIYKKILSSYLISDIIDLVNEIETVCTLKRTKEGNENFLKCLSIHYLNDCIPHFFKAAVPVVERCYEYLYGSGPELTAADICPIDLDTGRDLAFSSDLTKVPAYWETA